MRFSGVAGELVAWVTVSTVSPTGVLETVKTVCGALGLRPTR
jgi:hypothetical protein